MKKGEVWRVRLPLGPGHTQAGERPAVIVQDDPFNASLPTVMIVPFTSTQAATRFFGTLVVQPDGKNGLTIPLSCVGVSVERRGQTGLPETIGVLDPSTLDQVFAALDELTGR